MCIRDRINVSRAVKEGVKEKDLDVVSAVAVSYTHLDVYKRQIRKREWSDRLMKAVGVEAERLGGDIQASIYTAGKIERFGRVLFNQEVPVVLGAHDSECGILGLGVVPGKEGILGNISGTYEMLGCFANEASLKQKRCV